MTDIKDELNALLERVSSPETRKAGDVFFLADPIDLSVTYLPVDFNSFDIQSDSMSIDTVCQK